MLKKAPTTAMKRAAPGTGASKPGKAAAAGSKPPAAKRQKAAAPKAPATTTQAAAAAVTCQVGMAAVADAALELGSMGMAAPVSDAPNQLNNEASRPPIPTAAAAGGGQATAAGGAAARKRTKASDLDLEQVKAKIAAAVAAGTGVLKGVTVPEMQCYLKAHKLAVSGKKADLEARIISAMGGGAQTQA
jgi:hypothetical protein